ncbi:hypothetical protein OAS86_07230 [Gammaproteobacteria bacterium]|nr:hypothetical protein [Gammaproteobacteria bacterium]
MDFLDNWRPVVRVKFWLNRFVAAVALKYFKMFRSAKVPRPVTGRVDLDPMSHSSEVAMDKGIRGELAKIEDGDQFPNKTIPH